MQKELPVKRELAGRLMLVAEKSVPVRSGGEFQELNWNHTRREQKECTSDLLVR